MIKIIGIDASLSSTGFAVAKCTFEEKNKDFLFKLLTEKSGIDYKPLRNFFDLSYFTEIKEDKETLKRIARVRKRIRDFEKEGMQPNISDLIEEESLSTKRITDQVEQIISLIKHKEIDNCRQNFVFIEDYSYSSQGSLTQLAEMKGVLKVEMQDYINSDYLKDNNAYYYYLTANINTVKKVAARSGIAPKELICEELKRFGLETDLKLDDQADAQAIVLSAYYTIYNRLFPFVIPSGLKTKERNYYKSFIDSLNTFGNRIASKEELENICL